MILSVLEYGDIVYSGTTAKNLDKIDKLFYRGIRICLGNDVIYNKEELCSECNLTCLARRRDLHLLLFMYKQTDNNSLLKTCTIATRLHAAPVFGQCKPTNERVRMNLLYRGASLWNGLPVKTRNLSFKDFKNVLKRELLV